ncbi:hypothetical protein SNE40_023495 [Patella caerulea]|uniref:Uncharacterized protein n=1 Tax=Patella caerulea TaxID=87958 RepID=A0AAN8GI27_PATCE
MGRSIHADEAIQDYVEELIKSGQWYIGLILGQLTNPRDYILRLARTPDPVEDEASEEEDLEDIVPKKKPKKKGSRRPKTLDEMDDSWVATHAKQVIRMLPGGLEVAGVFILSPPNISQKVTEKLRQVVYAVHRSINKPGLLPAGEITDRITLHICSLTRKLTCRTYDVEDNNSNGHPAEWRYHPINDKWIQLNTSAFLDITIPVPSFRKSSTLIKQIQMGLTPFYKSLSTSIGLINGAFRDTSELLEMSSGKKSRSKDKSFMMPQSYNVELMIKKGDGKKVGDPQVTPVSSMIVLRGQMIGRAFIQGKPTVGDVIQAVKVDLARSISSRCELLCEDLEITEQDKAVELYNTPVRVFVIVPDSSVEICDYIFQDERTDEVTDRIKDLLDVKITENNLELDLERPAAEEDWLSYSTEEDNGPDSVNNVVGRDAKSNIVTYIGLAASGVVAAMAVVYNLFLTESTGS